jgi:hypothetical protein
MIRADKWGSKVVLGLNESYRKSAQSWRERLIDLKRHGLARAPEFAISDGALGFWAALHDVARAMIGAADAKLGPGVPAPCRGRAGGSSERLRAGAAGRSAPIQDGVHQGGGVADPRAFPIANRTPYVTALNAAERCGPRFRGFNLKRGAPAPLVHEPAMRPACEKLNRCRLTGPWPR